MIFFIVSSRDYAPEEKEAFIATLKKSSNDIVSMIAGQYSSKFDDIIDHIANADIDYEEDLIEMIEVVDMSLSKPPAECFKHDILLLTWEFIRQIVKEDSMSLHMEKIGRIKRILS